MKATGIVRKVDQLGRIVLPKELRDEMNLPVGTPLEIFTDEKSIMLQAYQRGCVFCGKTDNVVEFMGKSVCRDCIKKI